MPLRFDCRTENTIRAIRNYNGDTKLHGTTSTIPTANLSAFSVSHEPTSIGKTYERQHMPLSGRT